MSSDIKRRVQEALSHQHSGRLSVALALFEEILCDDPNNAQANFSLGIAAYQRGDIGVAIALLQKAARKAGKHPQPHQLLGLALLNAGDLKAAQTSLRRAVELAPGEADYHAQLGDLYRIKRQPVLARTCLDRALALDENNGYALLGMGQLEVTIGNIDEATGWFERAVASGREVPAALQCLTMARSYKERPEELELIESLLDKTAGMPIPDQANLHWAAGKIQDDLGDAHRAVGHFRSARRLLYSSFDIEAHTDRIEFMKTVFNERFFAEREEVASSSERPVFIFGMPRSGTTLVEQIVSHHSRISSGSEIPFFRHVQTEMGLMRPPDAAMERRLNSMEPREFRQIAKHYLADLLSIDRRADRVTDKMPHNFEMLWLIALLFPKAAYIHCVRSPADTCVSLLSHSLSPAHNYCFTQETLGKYFQVYHGLMKHWDKVLPVQLHHLGYENLVHNQEAESRALVARIGMAWEEGCLEFYKGDDPVTTFSNLQVRKPIFRSSIGRWRRHREILGDLFQALGPLSPLVLEDRDNQIASGERDFGTPDNDWSSQPSEDYEREACGH
ncbi:tetratricopeptide repeat protein [Rhodobacterales bacterium]|nr:tetratricopeptide repeat protein [Rhodobacterales bacterium]